MADTWKFNKGDLVISDHGLVMLVVEQTLSMRGTSYRVKLITAPESPYVGESGSFDTESFEARFKLMKWSIQKLYRLLYA